MYLKKRKPIFIPEDVSIPPLSYQERVERAVYKLTPLFPAIKTISVTTKFKNKRPVKMIIFNDGLDEEYVIRGTTIERRQVVDEIERIVLETALLTASKSGN